MPCPTSLKRWSQWLRSLLEQKGGIQAALLSYIRKPILSKPHSNDSRLSSSEIYLSPWPVVHQAFPQDDQRAPRFHHGCEEKQKFTAHPRIQRSCCRSFPSNVKTLRKLESLETSNSAAGNPQGRYLSQLHHWILGTQSAATLQNGGNRSKQILEGERNVRPANHPFAQ